MRPVMRPAALGVLAAAVLAVAGCGSSSGEKPDAARAPKAQGRISVTYDEPSDRDAANAKQLLKLGGTDGVAAGFTKSFRLPVAHSYSYFVTAAHTRAARDSMGEGALVAPELTVVLDADAEIARATAHRFASSYLGLENYTRKLREYGFTEDDVAGGGTDRLIDAVVAWGTPGPDPRPRPEHLDAGADHVCLQLIPDDFDPRAAGPGAALPLPRGGWWGHWGPC